MKTLKPVEVEWLDAVTRGGWAERASYEQSAPVLTCRSVGYLVKRDKEGIVIVQSDNGDGKLSDSITIPAGCITRVRRLK